MKVICKVENAECPKGFHICCGVCEHSPTCEVCCESILENSIYSCADAVVVTNEVVAFESAVPETIQKITSLVRLKKELDEQEKLLKQQLVEAMERYGVKSFENEQIKMTYVAPTTKTVIDSAKLKKEHPDIAELYSKTSNVSASVRVTVK